MDATQPVGVGLPTPSIPPLTCSIPEGLTTIPLGEGCKRGWHVEAGLRLDRQLRKVGRLSGAVDRMLALCLARVRERGTIKLGFSNYTAYVEQRLEFNARTARELVKLGKALPDLPLLDGALKNGRITWSAAHQVARLHNRIADEAEERSWVALAERLTVSALTEAVGKELKSKRTEGNPAHQPAQESDACEEEGQQEEREREEERDREREQEEDDKDNDDDDDPLVRLSARTGGDTARRWNAALELCEIVVGRPLYPGEGEEYLLAEYLSGVDPLPAGHIPCSPRREPRVSPPRQRRTPTAPSARTPEPEPEPELGGHQLPIELSEEIENALKLVDRKVPEDLFQLDATMRQLQGAQAGIDQDMGRLVRIFKRFSLAKHLGFDNFGHYARERLGISPAKANFLTTLDRKLARLWDIRQAVRKGEIGTVAAMLIAGVAQPGPSEEAWVLRARARFLDRLREEVNWAQRQAERLGWDYDGMPPPSAPLTSDLAELTKKISAAAAQAASAMGSHEPMVRLTGDPSIDDAARDEYLVASRARTGADEGDPFEISAAFSSEPLDDPSGTAADSPSGQPDDPFEISAGASSRAPETEPRWYEDPDGIPPEWRFPPLPFSPDSGPPTRVGFLLRESLVSMWTEARNHVGAAHALDFVSDSRVMYEVAMAFLSTYMPQWIEFVETADPIAVRDRIRCQIPGCPNFRGSPHHMKFRGRGGSDSSSNLLFLCELCHLTALHQLGSIRVGGYAPNLLLVEIGIRPDGTALETFMRRPSAKRAECELPETIAC